MIEGTEFALPRHGLTRHYQGDEQAEGSEEAGHGEPDIVEIGVEPVAHCDRRHWRVPGSRKRGFDLHGRRDAAGDGRNIAKHDLRRVRAPAVENDLNLRGPSRLNVTRKIRSEMQGGDDAAIVDRVPRFLLIGKAPEIAEGWRALKLLQKFDAPASGVAVQDPDIDVADVERRRIAEQKHLHEWRADQDEAAAWVAQHREQFLDDQCPEAAPHHSRLFLVLRTVKNRKTAPMPSMAAMFCRKSGQISPARNTVCRLGMR